MKHLYLLLAALLSAPALHAQAPDSLRLRLNHVFAPLDKSQVPTGRLLEYAEPLVPLEYYNGQRLDDTSRTTLTAWRGLYATAASARVAGSDTLPDLLTVNARLRAARPATAGAGPIPIAVQYIGYAALRHDAFSQNLLAVQNEQVYDVPGRARSPYQTNVLFAAAPARTEALTPSVSFVLRRNLFLSGDGRLPSQLALDFGDGQGYRPAAWGQPLGTTYATGGTKRVG